MPPSTISHLGRQTRGFHRTWLSKCVLPPQVRVAAPSACCRPKLLLCHGWVSLWLSELLPSGKMRSHNHSGGDWGSLQGRAQCMENGCLWEPGGECQTAGRRLDKAWVDRREEVHRTDQKQMGVMLTSGASFSRGNEEDEWLSMRAFWGQGRPHPRGHRCVYRFPSSYRGPRPFD